VGKWLRPYGKLKGEAVSKHVWMPAPLYLIGVVKPPRIVFLDLEQISVDFEIEHFETASIALPFFQFVRLVLTRCIDLYQNREK